MTRLHVAPDLEPPGPHVLVGVQLLGPGLGDPERAGEAGEDGQRDPEVGAERLAGVVEGEDVVRVADGALHVLVERGAGGVEPERPEAVRHLAAEVERRLHLVVVMAARRVELRAGQRLSHEHVVVGELLGEPAPSGLHRQGWQELRARRPHAPGGGVLPCTEGAKRRVLLVRQLEQLVELEVGRSHGERIREPDLIHGDRRLDAHSAQEIQLRLVFQLGGAQQGDVGLALRHFGLTHVEERGLSDLVARASEGQEVGIPDHLLPGHIHLGNRLQRVEVLGGDLVAEVDAGAGDVLFGGLLQRFLLAGTREDPPVELPVQCRGCTPRRGTRTCRR